MLINFLQKNIFTKKIIYTVAFYRAKNIYKQIKPYLRGRILEVGAGTCNVGEEIKKNGHDVALLDVKNLSFVDGVSPILYDGKKMPFYDNQFDVSLVLTVLHHTSMPKNIIAEAKRVSKRIIIIEDIYDNKMQKYLTYFFDSLLNLEFWGHPHSNKNDKEWKKIFNIFNLKLIGVKYRMSFSIFKQAIYCLEK